MILATVYALAWMSNWQYANDVPTRQYRSANSVPRDLSLYTSEGETYVKVTLLGGIGAVSLLVAAIGIANTMMMSIYERTKEIGVMKVLGCSLRNIREMFLLEAAFIGLLGGIAGNILSFVMSAAINVIVGSSGAMSMGTDSTISYIPWWLVLMSMVFAVLVGVLAGYFPAKRAMKLSPLAAIRNEYR